MNLLIDKVPEFVEIENQRYPINSSFRAAILFEQLMQDDALSDLEKIREALLLFYGETSGPIVEKTERIIWFYSCGKDGADHSKTEEKRQGKTSRHIYSFEHDAEYIYAAFLSQYGIDLQETVDLHWWKFMALFKSLSADNEICRIMQIRAMELDSSMSAKQKERYLKLKRLYALPDMRTEQEKAQDFSKAFLAGMQR